MTLKQSYAALGLKFGADLAEVKRAYRRLAFSLHPDLNPDVRDAARRFQEINEAYVFLTQYAASARAAKERGAEEAGATARAREEAGKAYSKARQSGEFTASGRKEKASSAKRDKEDVLKDILNDPFARRVFEDIYSHIRKEETPGAAASSQTAGQAPSSGGSGAAKDAQPWSPAIAVPGAAVLGKVKGWLRKQIDDEQVVRLPGESLVPGARVRLEIQHGLGGDPQVVEITLPPEFVPGKAMRLKGMGRRLGSLRGDLYVRIEAT